MCYAESLRTQWFSGRNRYWKGKRKAAASQRYNTYTVFNYLLVLHLEQGHLFSNWGMFMTDLKTRKGFSMFWSNKSGDLFPDEIHTAAFKDSFPSMFYSSHSCQEGQQSPQQCLKPMLVVLFYSSLTYCVGGDSILLQTCYFAYKWQAMDKPKGKTHSNWQKSLKLKSKDMKH